MNDKEIIIHHLGLSPAIEFLFPDNLDVSERETLEKVFGNLAISIRQQHNELSFERLISIIVTDDVLETVSKLEGAIGRELPSARNGANNLVAFNVDFGPFDVMVYRSELTRGFLIEHPAQGDAYWQFLKALAAIDYFTKVKAKFSSDPWRASASVAELELFGVASDLLSSYWSGYFSYHPKNVTVDPFAELIGLIPIEVKDIESAFSVNAQYPDDRLLFIKLHASSMFLCTSMAMVMGYCDSANQSLPNLSAKAWDMIVKWNFEDLWFKMERIIRPVFNDRHQWAGSADLLPVSGISEYFVQRYGVAFASDGGNSLFATVPIVTGTSH